MEGSPIPWAWGPSHSEPGPRHRAAALGLGLGWARAQALGPRPMDGAILPSLLVPPAVRKPVQISNSSNHLGGRGRGGYISPDITTFVGID
jgi:hypothetical protein